jgi:hypothetical protein
LINDNGKKILSPDRFSFTVNFIARCIQCKKDSIQLLRKIASPRQEEIQVVGVTPIIVPPVDSGSTGEKKLRVAFAYASQDSIL